MQSSKSTYLRVLEDSLRVNTAKYAVGMRISGLHRIGRFRTDSITGYIIRVADVIGRIEYLVKADDGSRHWILEDDIQVLSIVVAKVAIVPQQITQIAA